MSTHAPRTGRRAKRAHPSLSAPDAPFATILVGAEQERFVVHERLLTHYSEFFHAALTGRFKEAEEKLVPLKEVEPETFGFFVHWLYNRHFPSHERDDDPETIDAFYYEDVPDRTAIVKLYIFGDMYECRDLRRAAIDLLFAEVVTNDNVLFNSDDVSLAFQHLQPRDPLCRLLVDMTLVYDHAEDEADSREGQTSIPFLKALWARYVRGLQRKEDMLALTLHLCDYHEHADDEERKVCEKERGEARSDQSDDSDSDYETEGSE